MLNTNEHLHFYLYRLLLLLVLLLLLPLLLLPLLSLLYYYGGSVAHEVRRSPPTAEFASRSLYVGFVMNEMESGQVFLRFPQPRISFHHFSI